MRSTIYNVCLIQCTPVPVHIYRSFTVSDLTLMPVCGYFFLSVCASVILTSVYLYEGIRIPVCTHSVYVKCVTESISPSLVSTPHFTFNEAMVILSSSCQNSLQLTS